MNTDFSSCSIGEVQGLIALAKSGSIDLRRFWAVGDTRVIPVPHRLQHDFNDTCVSVSIKHIGECGLNQSIELEGSFYANNKCIAKGHDYIENVINQVIQSQFATFPASSVAQLDSAISKSKDR